jgi:hypothetical protein
MALALLDWKEIDADRQELVKRLVRDQMRAVLSGLAAQRRAAAPAAQTSTGGAQAPRVRTKGASSKRPRRRPSLTR